MSTAPSETGRQRKTAINKRQIPERKEDFGEIRDDCSIVKEIDPEQDGRRHDLALAAHLIEAA